MELKVQRLLDRMIRMMNIITVSASYSSTLWFHPVDIASTSCAARSNADALHPAKKCKALLQ